MEGIGINRVGNVEKVEGGLGGGVDRIDRIYRIWGYSLRGSAYLCVRNKLRGNLTV